MKYAKVEEESRRMMRFFVESVFWYPDASRAFCAII
jgi:hypothetical protein